MANKEEDEDNKDEEQEEEGGKEKKKVEKEEKMDAAIIFNQALHEAENVRPNLLLITFNADSNV